MKQVTLFLLLIVALSILFGCSDSYSELNKDIQVDSSSLDEITLPNEFTVHLFTDGTSGGATRHYDFYVTFNGDDVLFANRTYYSSGSDGDNFCYESYNILDKKWDTPGWVGVYAKSIQESGEAPKPCSTYEYLDRNSLMNEIKSGKLVTFSKGCHYVTCYEII